MSKTQQSEMDLPLFQEPKGSDNVEWFVSFLGGAVAAERAENGWIRASAICEMIGWPVTDNNKRKLRAWADASGGRVCGHQKGYKLTVSMTQEEYTWWRSEWLKARDSIEGRVIETDKVFYAKKAV